jgi:hypothetical protein
VKHIVFYSGGIGSWATANRIINEYGKDDVLLLFTDTLIEDKDLYRFLLETVQGFYNTNYQDLIEKTKNIPPVSIETMKERKKYLIDLAKQTRKRNENFIWINDGREPWEIFKNKKYLGNSRIAQCSNVLKQKLSKSWVKNNFNNKECILYLGIDWSESHRTIAPIENWKPYHVKFPMCEIPFLSKKEMIDDLMNQDIEQPKLYKMGFSHNNCGGFCVRAGQGHFIKLLRELPDLYKYHENKEQDMIKLLEKYYGKKYSILRRQINNEKVNLTLKELREEWESNNKDLIDVNDIGGCGCFVTI